MRIYVNNQNRISAVNTATNPELRELELPDNAFSPDITEELINCYSCQIDESGNYTIQLLVPPDMAEQINQIGVRRQADQETITELQLALMDQYEQNTRLEESLTTAQLAIIQLYEGDTV